MTVSYLHDSLRELVMAMTAMARFGGASHVVFLDEPGEHRVTFSNTESGVCHFTVDWFDDWASWGLGSEFRFHRLMEGHVPFGRWLRQVHSQLQRILDEFGPQGYLERWQQHEFPLQEMRELQKCISDLVDTDPDSGN